MKRSTKDFIHTVVEAVMSRLEHVIITTIITLGIGGIIGGCNHLNLKHQQEQINQLQKGE